MLERATRGQMCIWSVLDWVLKAPKGLFWPKNGRKHIFKSVQMGLKTLFDGLTKIALGENFDEKQRKNNI